MNRIIKYGISAALTLMAACGCGKHEEVFFDTPFVTITDDTKFLSSMTIDKDANNKIAELCISINASRKYSQEAIVIEYELIAGDGLKEGVDFRLQASTASPVTFKPGTTEMPVRVLWLRNPDLDPGKDNTLKVRLTSSSIPEMVLGTPGPSGNNREFIFEKKTTE
jgi:hypothetical protein